MVNLYFHTIFPQKQGECIRIPPENLCFYFFILFFSPEFSVHQLGRDLHTCDNLYILQLLLYQGILV